MSIRWRLLHLETLRGRILRVICSPPKDFSLLGDIPKVQSKGPSSRQESPGAIPDVPGSRWG